jgi:hypothetical protein
MVVETARIASPRFETARIVSPNLTRSEKLATTISPYCFSLL